MADSLTCQRPERRDAVRRLNGWNGLDYVDVSADQLSVTVYFLGKLPPELRMETGALARFAVEGGRQVRGIRITGAEPVVEDDPEVDDRLILSLDRYGDFSTYTLRVRDVDRFDPRYDHLDFSFKVDCPSDLDCAPACDCPPDPLPQPEISYLAKDYGSFRQLIYNRLALLMPDWQERHAPDLYVALVELLAYTGDYLSYYQDSVATEAYLDTARQRISVRRHARLVDYFLHEGCNARAWVCVETAEEGVQLDPARTAFITKLATGASLPSVLEWDALGTVPGSAYEVFEPVVADRTQPIALYPAHREIRFYTFGDMECCLVRGSTSAALLDAWTDEDGARSLQLQPGDVLIFEEVIGPRTGLPADADPTRRQAVRLTRVERREDEVIRADDGRPTPYLEVEWDRADALRFAFCISTVGAAPLCPYLDNVSVARGNVILVDHGRTVGPTDVGTVEPSPTETACECAGHPGDAAEEARPFRPKLTDTPLTYCEPLAKADFRAPAVGALAQDVRAARPQVWLDSSPPPGKWTAVADLFGSGQQDCGFVVETDNDGVAHLRFGDGELGRQPAAGEDFTATYRIGNGRRGNVGAEAISHVVLTGKMLSGVSFIVRNPLPAAGGTEPETLAEAKLLIPSLFRRDLARAITAQDYAQIARRDTRLQRAGAALEWTGSWYEADVCVDPLGSEEASRDLLESVTHELQPYRRVGVDLRVRPARYVPLDLKLEVCCQGQHQRAHVKAALLSVFRAGTLPDGRPGFFHPDRWTFGQGVYLSQLVAEAQGVTGVESVTVTRLQRQFSPPAGELANGVLPIRDDEIAQCDNDPAQPDHGKLEIVVCGGR